MNLKLQLELCLILNLHLSTILVFGLQCYSTRFQPKEDTNDGVVVNCPPTAEHPVRHCIKFKDDTYATYRWNEIWRDCDHTYEEIMGYDVFNTSILGCRTYTKRLVGMNTNGWLCVCDTDFCNAGIVF